MPGVKIGDGAIIASQSVITKDVSPYTTVGGNPAQVIRSRFSPEKIQQLCEEKWWNRPVDRGPFGPGTFSVVVAKN
jgi:serine acetyltransferase